MKRGFTLLEVLIATIILGSGIAGILVAMSQSQRMMLSQTDIETAQEVFDLGEMAYPLEGLKDEDDLDVRETRATELWDKISEERMTSEQEDKFHGYTWERVNLDKNINDDDLKRMNNIYRVKVTVVWGDRGKGRNKKQEESYVTLWRKPE